MVGKTLLFFSLVVFGVAGFGQARRVPPADSGNIPVKASEPQVSPKALYEEAEGFLKKRFEEYNQKKIPYSENLYNVTLKEQRRIAAKSAARLSLQKEIAGEGLYYLGMLYWIAEDTDAAEASLGRYADGKDTEITKLQASRAILAVVFARKKKLAEAEKIFADYLKNEPSGPREKLKVLAEFAKAYLFAGDHKAAAGHAESALNGYKAIFREQASRERGLQDIIDAGRALFEIYQDAGDHEKAGMALDGLILTGITLDSIGIYYEFLDAKIRMMAETGQKKEAMALYEDSLKSIQKNFRGKAYQDDLMRTLRKREKHYRLLGEAAPELIIDRWLISPKTMEGMKGKVVLLDYWATWCGPCIAAFPKLRTWAETYRSEGLEIIGLTRYYGMADGMQADEEAEIAFLQKFRKAHKLPYDFAIAKDTINHNAYGAGALPTAIVIDRKGIIRYARTGVGKEEELEKLIRKVLAEK